MPMGASPEGKTPTLPHEAGLQSITDVIGSHVPRTARIYIDGLNLYHGIRESMKSGDLDGTALWLDIAALASSMLDPGESLEMVRYFNAPGWLYWMEQT